MFAIGFLLPVLSMYAGIAIALAMGRLDDWQYGSGIGLVSGCLAAVLVVLGMKLGSILRRAQLPYGEAIVNSRSAK
jgi:hypothetical protein